MKKIFEPIKVKGVEFKNRVVMAAFANLKLLSENGVMGDELLKYHLQFADKEIGLVILEELLVMPLIQDLPWAVEEANMAPLRKIVEKCHENGTRIFAALALNGREFAQKGGLNALSTQEMEEIRDAFVHSAKLCKEAGFDGVDLDGAHELFLNQVSSAITNKRTDRYGGNQEGRATFAKEIASGIKAFADPSFILSYRFGASFDLIQDAKLAKILEEAGYEMLLVSHGISYGRGVSVPPEYEGDSETLYAGTQIKKAVNIPVVAISRINTLAKGEALLERGDCDFCAYGRPFASDPAFVIHSKQAEE